MTRRDIVEQLRAWCHDINAVPASDIMDEAASEIERLRHRLGFTDNVIRSGDVATLTDAERSAVADAADRYAESVPEAAKTAATLRSLLDRLA